MNKKETKNKNLTKHIAIRIPQDINIELDSFIEKHRRTKSWIIREAIEQYLQTYNKLKTIVPSFSKTIKEYQKLDKRIFKCNQMGLVDKVLKDTKQQISK
jgi:predicted DNA-binding protein